MMQHCACFLFYLGQKSTLKYKAYTKFKTLYFLPPSVLILCEIGYERQDRSCCQILGLTQCSEIHGRILGHSKGVMASGYYLSEYLFYVAENSHDYYSRAKSPNALSYLFHINTNPLWYFDIHFMWKSYLYLLYMVCCYSVKSFHKLTLQSLHPSCEEGFAMITNLTAEISNK